MNPYRPFQIGFFFLLIVGGAVMYATGHYGLAAFDLAVAMLNFYQATRT
jgi:hypothetical protein